MMKVSLYTFYLVFTATFFLGCQHRDTQKSAKEKAIIGFGKSGLFKETRDIMLWGLKIDKDFSCVYFSDLSLKESIRTSRVSRFLTAKSATIHPYSLSEILNNKDSFLKNHYKYIPIALNIDEWHSLGEKFSENYILGHDDNFGQYTYQDVKKFLEQTAKYENPTLNPCEFPQDIRKDIIQKAGLAIPE
ncbi:MAG: hypothetical protein R3B45_01325 [Bdellovibrionota bacterium]